MADFEKHKQRFVGSGFILNIIFLGFLSCIALLYCTRRGLCLELKARRVASSTSLQLLQLLKTSFL